MFPKQNKAAPIILAYIDANPESTAPEIAAALDMNKRKVETNVNRLIALKLIHISGYMQPAGSGKAARVLEFGPGSNAERPKAHHLRTRKIKAEWSRNHRAQMAVRRNATRYGVFGVVAAQIERRA